MYNTCNNCTQLNSMLLLYMVVAKGREEQDIFRDKALVCGQRGFLWGYVIEILLRVTCICTMKKINKVMADIPGWLGQGEEEYQGKYLYRC